MGLVFLAILTFSCQQTNALPDFPTTQLVVAAALPANQMIHRLVVEGGEKDGKTRFADATAKVSAARVAMEPIMTASATVKRAFAGI
jgi:hypothetical protein